MKLRDRIGVTFALYGVVSGFLLAVMVTLAFFELEDRLLDRMLEQTASRVAATPAGATDLRLPEGFTLYVGEAAPAEVRAYADGIHEFAQYRHVAVFAGDPPRYLVFDASLAGFDVVLSRMLFLTLLAMLVIVVAGVFAARIVSRKLTQRMALLVERIDRIDLENPVLEPLEGDDEIGTLSARFAAAVDLLHAKDRRERDFTRFASHELRSPLTVLRGSTQLLRAEQGLSERSARALARAESAVQRMARLIDVFLFLGRSDTVAQATPVSAAEVAAQLREIAAAHAADLRIDIHAQDGEFVTDPDLLSIALENLVLNAAHHGDGALEATIAPPSIVLENRVSPGSVRGHGFGLEICQRICERLGLVMQAGTVEDRFRVSLEAVGTPSAATA